MTVPQSGQAATALQQVQGQRRSEIQLDHAFAVLGRAVQLGFLDIQLGGVAADAVQAEAGVQAADAHAAGQRFAGGRRGRDVQRGRVHGHWLLCGSIASLGMATLASTLVARAAGSVMSPWKTTSRPATSSADF
ncbi:hypothetical protein G6F40_016184 [Rhizopus arrhizus]|nr:hypothetical protein G6F40_016184 [Rhizopus arrhizus]